MEFSCTYFIMLLKHLYYASVDSTLLTFLKTPFESLKKISKLMY